MATAKRKRYGAEEIISKLREAEVGLAQGQTVAQVSRRLGISEQTPPGARVVRRACGSRASPLV